MAPPNEWGAVCRWTPTRRSRGPGSRGRDRSPSGGRGRAAGWRCRAAPPGRAPGSASPGSSLGVGVGFAIGLVTLQLAFQGPDVNGTVGSPTLQDARGVSQREIGQPEVLVLALDGGRIEVIGPGRGQCGDPVGVVRRREEAEERVGAAGPCRRDGVVPPPAEGLPRSAGELRDVSPTSNTTPSASTNSSPRVAVSSNRRSTSAVCLSWNLPGTRRCSSRYEVSTTRIRRVTPTPSCGRAPPAGRPGADPPRRGRGTARARCA